MPRPAGELRHGARRRPDGSVEWNVWAPRARGVEIAFTDGVTRWMEPTEHGWFSHCEPSGDAGRRYGFRLQHDWGLDGRVLPDPASRWQPEGVHRSSATYFPEDFSWTDSAWRGRPLGELVFYELHVGTFTEDGTFASVETRLDVLGELGVTAIEIMPVAQFPGNRGWGYDGVHPFAVQNTYGGPRGLQQLVDACHRRGLAVFLDVVYNHLGPEGNYGNEFGPYFTNHYRTPWGNAWNYDDRGCDAVRRFVCENVAYWLRDFHFDGLRLDAVQAIVDTSPTHILAEIRRTAEAVAAETGRAIHVIAESGTNDVRLLDPLERHGDGLAGLWNDDFHHAVHTLLTGERNGYYVDFGRPEHLVKALNDVFTYDGCYSKFRDRRHGAPPGDHGREKFVVAVQNHDQVGNRARGDRFGTLLSHGQQRLAAGLLLISPYTPLLFMGEEYGETRPFPFFCSFGDGGLIDAVRRGRRDEFKDFVWSDLIPDPQAEATFQSAHLSWSWPAESPQAALREWYRRLLEFRRTRLIPGDATCRASWHAVGDRDASSGILQLVRRSTAPDVGPIVACFNFGAAAASPPAAVAQIVSETDLSVALTSSEAGDLNAAAALAPWEVRVYARVKGENA